MEKDNIIDIDKLNKQHKDTLDAMIELGKTNNRVLCVRPTSWGKSYNVIRHLITYHKHNCILIVPSINLTYQYRQLNLYINIITMAKLRYLEEDEKKALFGGIKYVIVDETHHICSRTKCGNILDDILKKYNLKCYGFTATPIRSDGINVLNDFYNGIQVEPLYLNEAIEQKVLPNLKYVRTYANLDNEDISKLENKMTEIDRYDFHHLFNVPSILRRNITEDRLDNFKCIVYIPRNTMTNATKNKIYSWFKEAFPDYCINIYSQSWKQNKYENKEQLDQFQLVKDKDEIDVMLNIDMLEEGNHIDNVYAVILLRYTRSLPKYLQQIGRAINTHNNVYKQPLIIDIVSTITRIYVKENNDLSNSINKLGRMDKKLFFDDIEIIDELYPYKETLYKLLNTNKSWSLEEDNYLKTNYNGHNVNDLSKELKRTYYSVIKRLKRLDIKVDNCHEDKFTLVKNFIISNKDKQFSRNYLSNKFGVNYKTLDLWCEQDKEINYAISKNSTNIKSSEIKSIEEGIKNGYITSTKTIREILNDFNITYNSKVQQRLATYLTYHKLDYIREK